jgi:hypothetical protein
MTANPAWPGPFASIVPTLTRSPAARGRMPMRITAQAAFNYLLVSKQLM